MNNFQIHSSTSFSRWEHHSCVGSLRGLTLSYTDGSRSQSGVQAKHACNVHIYVRTATQCCFIWKFTLLLDPFGGLKFSCVLVDDVVYIQIHLHIPLPHKLGSTCDATVQQLRDEFWRDLESMIVLYEHFFYLHNNSSVIRNVRFSLF